MSTNQRLERVLVLFLKPISKLLFHHHYYHTHTHTHQGTGSEHQDPNIPKTHTFINRLLIDMQYTVKNIFS